MVSFCFRLFITRSIPQPVMFGALVVSCMRYGVWDTNHLRCTLIVRYAFPIGHIVVVLITIKVMMRLVSYRQQKWLRKVIVFHHHPDAQKNCTRS